MKKVELVDGIQSSVLGFGCAPILGSKDGNTSRRVLDMAFDYGINHFDLARSYGYGEAEKFVGSALAGKRDKIVLTSKFGIEANWKAEFMRPLKPVIRSFQKPNININKIDASLGKKGNNVADLFHNRIEINSFNMRNSLEKSLKALKTDYLDYFLIHEPLSAIINMDELCETTNRLKEEGKIRAWGLAFMKNQSHLHESYIHQFDILQFNNSPVEIDYQKITSERSSEANILFSPISGGKGRMSPAEKIKKLLCDYSKSVILCSMYNEKHLRENVDLAM